MICDVISRIERYAVRAQLSGGGAGFTFDLLLVLTVMNVPRVLYSCREAVSEGARGATGMGSGNIITAAGAAV